MSGSADARDPMRLIVADAHQIFRHGVKALLNELDWVDVVGEAGDLAALLELLAVVVADAVLLDPGISGGGDVPEGVRELRVLVVGSDDDPGLVRRAIESGAAGYLLRAAPIDELVTALSRLADGRHYLQAELVTAALLRPADVSPAELRGRMSLRQLDVLRLVTDGLDNGQVARRLGISETTVKSDLRIIYTQLDARNRVDAVARALRVGLVE